MRTLRDHFASLLALFSFTRIFDVSNPKYGGILIPKVRFYFEISKGKNAWEVYMGNPAAGINLLQDRHGLAGDMALFLFGKYGISVWLF